MNSDIVGQNNLFRLAKNWAGPSVILLVAISYLVWSWGLWPEPIIDFGRELYVPWRISLGEVLYRDFISFNGPFSPYLIALWFFCFGTSLASIAFFNFLILLATLLLVYVIFCRIGDKLSSTMACLTFITCFAFSQQISTGNFNWITPYSHEVTHGISLSLLSFYLLYRFLLSGDTKWFCFSGLVLGLVFLTKAEVFLASFLANLAGMLIFIFTDPTPAERKKKALFFWVVAALLPTIVSVSLFSMTIPFKQAFLSTMGTWPHMLNTSHTNLLFFKKVMGTEYPGKSIFLIFKVTGYYLLIFLPSFGLAYAVKKDNWLPKIVALCLFSIVGGILCACLILWGNFKWYYIPKPWQLFTMLLLLLFTIRIPKIKSTPKEIPIIALQYMIVLFSCVLLGKMLLNIRIAHYGFGLALPSAMVIVVLLSAWIPAFIKQRGGQGIIFQGPFIAAWLVTLWVHVSVTNHHFDKKTYSIGSGADLFKADDKGRYVGEALRILKQKASPGDTLAVLPEGVMLNYQLRMPISTPYVQYTPPLVTLYGEDTILNSLRKSPPDWIVLAHSDQSEYGLRFFGVDYAVNINRWITSNYTLAMQIGATPFRDRRQGMLILRRSGK